MSDLRVRDRSLINAYREGMSAKDVAEMFNVSQNRVYQILHREGVSLHRKPYVRLDSWDRERVQTMYRSGRYTLRELAREFGISLHATWRFATKPEEAK